MDELAGTTIGRTFNQYAAGARAPLLCERLARYLDERADASILLVGEAPGYRGARVSGIPFTSERQLTGTGPAEATATIVQRVLGELDLADDVLLWNVVPTHPGTDASNRRPTSAEVRAGTVFLRELACGRYVIAVGRIAHSVVGGEYVRHPSHGGAEAFGRGLRLLTTRAGHRAERRRKTALGSMTAASLVLPLNLGHVCLPEGRTSIDFGQIRPNGGWSLDFGPSALPSHARDRLAR